MVEGQGGSLRTGRRRKMIDGLKEWKLLRTSEENSSREEARGRRATKESCNGIKLTMMSL